MTARARGGAARRLGLLVPLWMATACGGASTGDPPAPRASPPDTVTFNRDVAPIVLAHCAPCHRPGEAGPFPLLTYADVHKRAPQIARVTAMRYMPPWPPEPGYGDLAQSRRLTDEQIALLQRWVAQGGPEGPPAAPPPAPVFTEGWQLGPPDLVLEAAQAYTLPAEGTDLFRNFVLPSGVHSTRHVRALELRPGDKRVVHHANVLLDRTGAARRRDARDPGPGFSGMDVELESDAFEPDSHFLFWKPGTAAVREPEGMAWTIDQRTDLVLNVHLQPSGKPETIRPVVGLYFTDAAPTKFPMLLQLEHDGAIDIPPGATGFSITDHYELPVDVDVLGIYPHAHYLGKDVQGYATLPDGSRQWLIWIRDWDFAWQAVYPLARAVSLPRGSVLHMRVSYDNSEANVRNPSQPPRRVRAGNRSVDEMGHLWVQVLPRQREDRWALQESFMRRRLEKYPGDFMAHANLGAALEARGRGADAALQYRAALRSRPDSAAVRNNLGAALQAGGDLQAAIAEYRRAAEAQPDYANARHNLGRALVLAGAFAEAVPHLREAVRLSPSDAVARNYLGGALLQTGHTREAIVELRRAVEADPRSLDAQFNLGRALAVAGRLAEAAGHFEEALRIAPEDPDARRELAAVRSRLAR
jgi:tetratricopeptide (TPR) repeat protein/mono/diheme cytochrome c family protein